MAGRLLTLVALPLVALLPFVEGFQLVPARPLFQRIAAVVPPRSALALVCMGMPGSKITGRGEPSLGGGASLPRPIPLPPLSLPSRFRYFCRNPFMDPVLLARALHRPNPDCPRKNGTGMDQYDIAVDGVKCKNGKLGKVIYDKILADQKRMYTQRPMAGFRAGTIPPQIMPRIKFAAVEQLCSQTCEAALEEEGLTMLKGQEELSTTNGLEFPGFDVADVPAFCKASQWKPGNDVSFRAFGVKATGGGGTVDPFPEAQTPEGISLSTSATLF